jgi:ABC-type Fe3+/spermidine/putrescine transport system ATPase subunit
VLEVKNIAFGYDDERSIFDGLSFSLDPGEVLSIVGPSGAGKSSLLKCIAGFNQINSGEILLEGKRIQGPLEQLIPGDDEIAYVHQNFENDLFYSCEENLLNALLHLPLDSRQDFCDELIDLMGLEDVRGMQSRFLSGGEMQRLSIAIALAKEPKLLLLDEPFVHLDVHLRKRLGKYVRDLSRIRGVGIILVTHEGDEALAWSDTIFCMFGGKITRRTSPQEAYQLPKSLKEGRFFGELNSYNVDGRTILFRPHQYTLDKIQGDKLDLIFSYCEFRGFYYANYFKMLNGREVVLYAPYSMENIKTVYVDTK